MLQIIGPAEGPYDEFVDPHGPDKPSLVLTPDQFDEYFSAEGTS